MSASTRPQHRLHRDRATTDNRHFAPGRIPLRPSSVEQSSSKSIQHISKLARKPIGREGSSDNAATKPAHIPVTAAHRHSIVPREHVVPPHSAFGAQYQGRTSRSTSTNTQPPPATRTPSLFSGSSAPTLSSPRSHGLRRKPSTVDSYTAQMRAHDPRIDAERATMHSRAEGYSEAFDDAVLGITLPPTGKYEYRDAYLTSAAPTNTLPHLDTQITYPMRDITPPVPGLSNSATPSSRYTDSPYSHVPTPSSASSYSSGVVASAAIDAKYAANSPLRPRPTSGVVGVTTNEDTRNPLPSVRESPASSSNSTIKSQQIKPTKRTPHTPAAPSESKSRKSNVDNTSLATHRKSSLPTQTAPAHAQVPPELAHLNVDTPLQSITHRPRRPSRDRTPSLTHLNKPSPVVHSDLPQLYTTYHKRTPSQDTNGSATSTSLRSRFGFPPRSSSKQGSLRVDSAFSPSPSSKRPIRQATPDSERPKVLRKDSPAVNQSPSPAPPSKSPRFSFLSRKSKVSPDNPTEKPKREARKGPVAGTGHERYARFGFRGRSGSTTTSQTISRSPSADSVASSVTKPGFSRKASTTSEDASDMDEFLRDRLNPVVLRGTRNYFGTQTSIWAGKDEESSSSPSLEDLPRPQLLPSAMTAGYDTPPVLSGAEQMNPQYDLSRDIPVEQSSAPGSHGLGNPFKSRTENVTQPEESREGNEGIWLRPLRKEPPSPQLKHKWNFFQRARSSHLNADLQGSNGITPTNTDVLTELHQDALRLGIFDEVVPVGLAEVERIVQEHDTSVPGLHGQGKHLSRLSSSASGRSAYWPSPAKIPSRESDVSDARRLSPSVMAGQILTESPELLKARAAIPQQSRQVVRMVTVPNLKLESIARSKQSHKISSVIATPELTHERNDTPETPQSLDIARQSRLWPIGRIPLVVSKRDRDRRLPDTSFSRPFASTQPRPTVRPPGSLYNQIRDLASPTDTASQPVSSTSGRSDTASAANQSSINVDQPSASTNRSSFDFYAGNDFIVFAPRKNSDFTYSSSSSSSNWRSLMPAHVSEDDIWNEYNDLMDDVIPDKTPVSAGSSLGAPFQYANMLHGNHSPVMPAPLHIERSVSQPMRATSPIPSTHDQNSLLLPTAIDSHTPQPPVSPMTPEEHAAVVLAESPENDCYTSRPVSPLTPDTLARFVGTYGDRSATSPILQHRLSLPPSRNDLLTPKDSISSRYSRNFRHSRINSLPEANARDSQISLATGSRLPRDTHLLDIPEHLAEKKTTASSDLRFGALMTSKWLSFGRVLFSPAHNEVRLADEARILVVDGLGDDWSHYVATSYPNAVVYNLCITPASYSEESGWGPLPNYRHFNHPSLGAPFPFPKGFFTAVVFRFPVAATEQKYQACILESKRVLRPGGHLEVVALDIDMMNMGTHGRRALRGLKTRMQQTDQDVSLGNLSDTLVRLIGRRGFEEVQRCVVGLPAAGRIPRSDDVFRSSSCSSNSTSGRPRTANSNSAEDHEINFATLLQKNRHSQIVEPGPANDEGITKMVARVGRWWYSACYEQPLLENDKSVWQERGLLRECEKQGTSFRLLICCAQKPLQPRRRTKSV